MSEPVIGHDGIHPVPMASEMFSDDDLHLYFTAISEGIGADLAARRIDSTGTVMKRLRNRDPEFAARYEESREQGQEHYRDRLAAQARLRALDRESPSDRMLEVELATHVPGYEHLRRDRVRHEGTVEHTHVLTPAQIEELDEDDLNALIRILSKATGAVIDGEFEEVRELPESSAA